MRWEELTSDEFPKAVAKAEGVCLLPLSCIERHAHHLPLGTDMFIGRDLCRRAAALEPALIFPDFIFTQILEAQHCAGTIAIEIDLILRMMDNICREIARNGLNKIVLVNAHGGNDHLIHFFLQMQLATPRDYLVYVAQPPLSAEDEAAVEAQWATEIDGHAGERETSAILAIRPDLVHPDQLHSDGTPATAAKGDHWLDARARALARAVRLIKADRETMRLQNEFFAASRHDRLPADTPESTG